MPNALACQREPTERPYRHLSKSMRLLLFLLMRNIEGQLVSRAVPLGRGDVKPWRAALAWHACHARPAEEPGRTFLTNEELGFDFTNTIYSHHAREPFGKPLSVTCVARFSERL